MNTLARSATLVLLLAAGASAGWAQKSTEMFVPVGMSAGLSGRHTVMARVEAVQVAERRLVLMHEGARLAVQLADTTPLWLDRSRLQQANSRGRLADVQAGLLAEVKYLKNDRSAGVVEWVKVQMQ